MKCKVLLSAILVLVIVSVAVLPVAADSPSLFTTEPLAVTVYEVTGYKEAGVTSHWTILLEATVDASDDRFDGVIVFDIQALCIPNPNEVPLSGLCWGPLQGSHWRLVTTTTGEELSGWEGVVTVNPWTNPTKWPDSQIWHASGRGFGLYKNMSVKFNMPTNAVDSVISGEIR